MSLLSRLSSRSKTPKKTSRGRENVSLDESSPPILPTPRRPLTPAPQNPLSSFGLFAILPLEIRQQILLDAFGSQTLHMDLAFRRPFAAQPPADSTGPSEPHARIYCSYTYFDNPQGFRRIQVDKSQPKAWRWFGCVCHHYPPGRRGPLGKMAPEAVDLSSDGCVLGNTECGDWPGTWPRRCFLGIMGWLLACRQA
jgi:hypothetical protein